MIESFGDSETEQLYAGRRSRKLPGEVQERARRKLRMLNQSRELVELRIPPSNNLEQLKGNMKGFWSIRVNRQWRIVFRWEDGRKRDVSIVDYH